MKLKGFHFADVAEIPEVVTDELKTVQKEEFLAAFQKLYKCAKACLYANGTYFEVFFLKKVYIIIIFKKISPKLFDCTVYTAIILTVDISVSDLTQSTQTVVFENMMLSRISGPNRTGITGRWRKMHIDKFYNLDFSANINRVINSKWIRKMRYKRQKKFIQTFSHKT